MTRYNLAFGRLSPTSAGGYTVDMNGKLAAAVKGQLRTQAPGVVINSITGGGAD